MATQAERYGYKVDTRGDFLSNDAVRPGLKTRVEALVGIWVLWDPSDDEDGYLIVGDSPDQLTDEAAAHFGW